MKTRPPKKGLKNLEPLEMRSAKPTKPVPTFEQITAGRIEYKIGDCTYYIKPDNYERRVNELKRDSANQKPVANDN